MTDDIKKVSEFGIFVKEYGAIDITAPYFKERRKG
jgi:hypothetical protein